MLPNIFILRRYIQKMSVAPFSELDVKTLVVKKPRANPQAGKSAWIDRTSSDMPNLFSVVDAKAQWPIRPGNTDGTVKQFERLNFEIGVTPKEEEVAKKCDEVFQKALFDMKIDFFGPSKGKSITSVESLGPIYKNLLREGGEGKEGTKYANSLRMKVDGWSQYIDNVNVVEKVKANGEKLKVVKDCSWKNRLVDSGDAPGDRDTHFLLFLGNNPDTGKPRYSDKVVVMDDFGKPIIKSTDKDGKVNYQMRYVGPQDAAPGSTVTVVWQLSKLYLTETTGPISVAKDVYIKPIQKKAQAHRAIDGVEIDDAAEDTIKVQEKIAPPSPKDDVPPPIDDQDHEHEMLSASAQPSPDRKRKSDDSAPGAPTKKSKKIVVSEDF